MKSKGKHEDCIEQTVRLFNQRLYGGDLQLDASGRIRIDDWEMEPEIQAAVQEIWPEITSETLIELSDFSAYQKTFSIYLALQSKGSIMKLKLMLMYLCLVFPKGQIA